MSSDANCSFCSKVDDSIHVICEKRCLICAHCQRSAAIRQLLISCLDRAVTSSKGPQSDPQCPLCHHTMAPNMVTNIKRSRKELATQARLSASDALLETPNVLRLLNVVSIPPPQGRRRELRTMRSGITRQPSNATLGQRTAGSERLSLAAVNMKNQFMTSSASMNERDDDMDSLKSLDELSVSTVDDEDVLVSNRRNTRQGSMRIETSASSMRKQSSKSFAKTPVSSPTKQRQPANSKGKLSDVPEDEIEQAVTPQHGQVSPYTQHMALELIVDIYVKMWNAYLQDNFEPMSTHLRDYLSRGRMSKNMIDAKVKNVMDYFTNVQPDTTLDPSLSVHPLQHTQNPHLGKYDSPQQHINRTSLVATPTALSRGQFSSDKPQAKVLGAFSVVNTHLHLFGYLLGLQPGSVVHSTVLPMQGYIAVIIMVMAVCERCLRYNQLVSTSDDSPGVMQPTTGELASRLCPIHLAARQPLTGRKLLVIPLKKALSILKCLLHTDEYRFNMCALKSACVEYNVSHPWKSSASLSALLHCFLSPNEEDISLLEHYHANMMSQNTVSSTTTEVVPATLSGNVNNTQTTTSTNSAVVARFKRAQSSIAAAAAFTASSNDTLNSKPTFPPVHLLGGAVNKVWAGKNSLPPFTFDKALATCKARGLLISLPYFVTVCVEAWKAELNGVMNAIAIQRQANLRRHGLRPHANPFQKSVRVMNIAQKKALKYIYDAFADKTISTFETRMPDNCDGESSGQLNSPQISRSLASISSQETLTDTLRTGIDWEEVRERAMKAGTISAIPFVSDVKEFLRKSNAELEHLARIVMLEFCKRKEWQYLMDGYGWQDEWCWGGVGMQYRTAAEKENSVGNDILNNSPPSSPISGNALSQGEHRHMRSPPTIESSQWEILSMRPPSMGDYVVATSSLSREKLQQVLSKAGIGSHTILDEHQVTMLTEVYDGSVGVDTSNEQHSEDEPHSEGQKSLEQEASTSSDDVKYNREESSKNERGIEKDASICTPVQMPSKALSRATSRACISRKPSMQELLHDDFDTYFRENNSRTLQIQRSFMDTAPFPSKNLKNNPNEEEHFVVCNNQGVHSTESQGVAAQLYVKKKSGESKSFKSRMMTPAPVAPHLEYAQSKMGVLKRNPWDSPYPVRNRVHLADIVNTKKQHDDIFVKTGLLCPLKLSTSQKDSISNDGKQGTDESEREDKKRSDDESKHCDSNASQHNNVLLTSTSMPVLSTLQELEFSVNPSQLAMRLTEKPFGTDEEDDEAAGLIFRTMSPVGARNRSHMDLGHFSHMRPSEQPNVSSQCEVESLNFADSLLTAAALSSILESITKSKGVINHLRKIDLSGNRVGDEGVLRLSDILSRGCSHIEDISVRGNQVSDAGAVELVQAILDGGGGQSLLKIDFGSNVLTLSNPRLVGLIVQCSKLRVLDLSWNTITLRTYSEKKSASTLIEKCTQLQVLSISYNRMGDGGVLTFLSALEKAPKMKLVDMAYCFCTLKVVKPLLSLMRKSHEVAGVELVMLHGVALPLADTEELIATAADCGRKVILEGHHTGITINLKYS